MAPEISVYAGIRNGLGNHFFTLILVANSEQRNILEIEPYPAIHPDFLPGITKLGLQLKNRPSKTVLPFSSINIHSLTENTVGTQYLPQRFMSTTIYCGSQYIIRGTQPDIYAEISVKLS